MTLRDMLPAIDTGLPVWVHSRIEHEEPAPFESYDYTANRYECAGDIPAELHPAEVDYITIDGEGEMTVEITLFCNSAHQ